jgi:sugar phosphate isomerase/epimerase
MEFTRREFGKLALAGLPAAAWGTGSLAAKALQTARPNSVINGVRIGAITYSYRSMPDQSAEAILKYVVDSGINAIEFMGAPVERFAGAPTPAGRGGGGAAGRAGGGAGGNRAGGDGPATQATAATAPLSEAAPLPTGPQAAGQWNGQPCATPGARGGGGGNTPQGAGGNRGGGGGGRGGPSPEQQDAATALRQWRTTVSMDRFKALRQMFNDAGVTIYAWKQLNPNMSDEEFEYVFNVAEALGCTHTTLELPDGPNAAAQLKRIGDFAEKKKIYAAYHTHLQGSITAFDDAFALSKGNMANVDLGHYVAAGGNALEFLNKFHDRISSFHLKDRTTPDHCTLNLPWGRGETPIREILQTVRRNRWTMPATIEVEYSIPAGSDAVKETARCLDFCRQALA